MKNLKKYLRFIAIISLCILYGFAQCYFNNISYIYIPIIAISILVITAILTCLGIFLNMLFDQTMKKHSLKISPYHYDSITKDGDKIKFNTYVYCATVNIFGKLKDWECTGRLIQVRKAESRYDDLFLIRRCDGSIITITNESFYALNEEGIKYVEKYFSNIELDSPNKEYSIEEKENRIGFITTV